MTLTFNNECDQDEFKFKSGYTSMPLQQYQLRSNTNLYINFGTRMEHSMTQCAYTDQVLVWNENTLAWDDIATTVLPGDFTILSSKTTLRFNTDKAAIVYSDYQPEKFYKFKKVWTSTYSEKATATLEDEFEIRFFDPCYDNELSISTEL